MGMVVLEVESRLEALKWLFSEIALNNRDGLVIKSCLSTEVLEIEVKINYNKPLNEKNIRLRNVIYEIL